MLHVYAKQICAAMLLALALSLMGCASNCPMPPAASPQLPPAPSLSTPLPQTSYSLTAAERIKGWRQKLMGTSMMSEPSSRPGQ